MLKPTIGEKLNEDMAVVRVEWGTDPYYVSSTKFSSGMGR